MQLKEINLTDTHAARQYGGYSVVLRFAPQDREDIENIITTMLMEAYAARVDQVRNLSYKVEN